MTAARRKGEDSFCRTYAQTERLKWRICMRHVLTTSSKIANGCLSSESEARCKGAYMRYRKNQHCHLSFGSRGVQMLLIQRALVCSACVIKKKMYF